MTVGSHLQVAGNLLKGDGLGLSEELVGAEIRVVHLCILYIVETCAADDTLINHAVVEALAKEVGAPAQAANMVLLGAAIPMLGIDHDKMIAGVARVFARKGETVVNTNIAAVEAGYNYALSVR